MTAASPPIVWSIAGTDSGGGAGLSADQRAADAFGVHLCPVVACVTAQHSRAVTHFEPVSEAALDAQLSALAEDMPPNVVKTGLLGSAAQVRLVARWIDTLRKAGPVALVVDPVLSASTGRRFADDELIAAYRNELLPRATLLTPNRREAASLLGVHDDGRHTGVPALARGLRETGTQAVAITGGDSLAHHDRVIDWIDTPQASGWLAAPYVDTPHTHGTGCTFATSAASALALGHVPADALVLAKMATLQALRHSRAAGKGAGPVHAVPGFGSDPTLMPLLSWGETPTFGAATNDDDLLLPRGPSPFDSLDLYAVVDSAVRVAQVLAAGVRTVQLRIKAEAPLPASLVEEIRTSVDLCHRAGAQLFVNDHWTLAVELGAEGVHLGQEDLLALGEGGRERLASSGLALGISSHSLWELARARALSPRYVACGPVWPTLTKAMPWVSQGLANLRWWCQMASHPVVAIGGILSAAQAEAAARCGVDGVCVVRGLGQAPELTVPAFERAMRVGRAAAALAAPPLPHPTLAGVR